MSSVSAVQRSEVQGAIARASAATGVDFDYLLAQARIESGLNAGAKAGTSSAAGLYQFIDSTWLETLDRHGGNHGLGWADAAITRTGGRPSIADPAARAQVMALRFDPEASAMMAAELARDNGAELKGFLGREAEPAELYLAHFLGIAGARSFLGAMAEDAQAPAAALFPRPAAANRAIFFDGARARGLGEVMDLVSAKVAGAMDGSNEPRGANERSFPAPPSFSWTAPDFGGRTTARKRIPMSETLQATFGGSAHIGTQAASRIGEAYGKFRAFGL